MGNIQNRISSPEATGGAGSSFEQKVRSFPSSGPEALRILCAAIRTICSVTKDNCCIELGALREQYHLHRQSQLGELFVELKKGCS